MAKGTRMRGDANKGENKPPADKHNPKSARDPKPSKDPIGQGYNNADRNPLQW